MVVGPREVVETLGAGLQVAAPPLVEPDLGAADGGADGVDGSAGEAQGDGSMTSGEFVVHGYLREAAAGGLPAGVVLHQDRTWGAISGAVRQDTRRRRAQRCAVGPKRQEISD